jgi:hypothetical protein
LVSNAVAARLFDANVAGRAQVALAIPVLVAAARRIARRAIVAAAVDVGLPPVRDVILTVGFDTLLHFAVKAVAIGVELAGAAAIAGSAGTAAIDTCFVPVPDLVAAAGRSTGSVDADERCTVRVASTRLAGQAMRAAVLVAAHIAFITVRFRVVAGRASLAASAAVDSRFVPVGFAIATVR